MAVVMMSIADILLKDSVDSSWYAEQRLCEECEDPFDDADYFGKGEYVMRHSGGYAYDVCEREVSFTTRDIIDLKADDEWFTDVVYSLIFDNNPRPLARVSNGRIWDGHHRIAAAIRLGKTHIPIDNQTAGAEYGEEWQRESSVFVPGEHGEPVVRPELIEPFRQIPGQLALDIPFQHSLLEYA